MSEEQLRLEVNGEVPNVTLVGVSLHVRPGGVEAETVKEIVPVRPLTVVMVVVEVPEAPAKICPGLTSPTAIVKSTTWKRIATVV